jgi:hypothetical protein
MHDLASKGKVFHPVSNYVLRNLLSAVVSVGSVLLVVLYTNDFSVIFTPHP